VSANPESDIVSRSSHRDSGFDAELVIAPRFARTRLHRPGKTTNYETILAAEFTASIVAIGCCIIPELRDGADGR
jgi:hypothetical protein